MFCKNCGQQLMGNENVCPNCGNPVENSNPAVPQPESPVVVQPESPTVVQPESPAVMQPETPVQPQPTMQAQPVNQTPTENTPKKNNNTTLILVIALLAVILIAVVLYFVVFKNDTKEVATPNEPAETTTTEDTNTAIANTQSYGGYTFTIPDGYVSKISDDYGLVVGNKENGIAFIIAIDYTNSYDAYKTAFSQKYPDLVSGMIATVSGREYIALTLTDTDGSQAVQYVTKASDYATFVGLVIKSDYTVATVDDLTVLTNILNSATSGSNFAPGDSEDIGANGIKEFTFDRSIASDIE